MVKQLKRRPKDWDEEFGPFEPGWYIKTDAYELVVRYIGPYKTKTETEDINRGMNKVVRWLRKSTKDQKTSSE